MFFVNYDPTTGNIISYTGDAPDASHNDCPDGCQTLSFNTAIADFTNSNGACLMKVDVVNKLLVLINPKVIPAPINV